MNQADDDKLLERWLEDVNIGQPEISQVPPDKQVLATAGQKGIWILDKLHPDDPLYIYPEIISIQGTKLDVEALEGSLNAIIQSHAILRTNYRFDGEDLHLVERSFQMVLEVHDVSATRHPAESSKAVIDELSRKPFDLAQDLMIRAHLIKEREDMYRLLLLIHHIALDNYSVDLLHEEISAYYHHFVAHPNYQVNSPAIGFRDFAYWLSQQPPSKEAIAFWKNKLKDPPNEPYVHPDRQGGSRLSVDGAFLASPPIEGQRLLALEKLAKDAGVSNYVLFVGLFQILLSRYSGFDDIVLGTPVINRKVSGLEQVFGYFTNTLVLREIIDIKLSFLQILSKVNAMVLESLDHGDVPFERIIAELNPERKPGQNPLFDIMLSYGEKPCAVQIPGCLVTHELPDLGISKFDLTLQIVKEVDKISLGLEYRSGIFQQATISRLLEGLHALIEEVLAKPSAPISSLVLFPEKIQREAAQADSTLEIRTLIDDLLRSFEMNSERIAIQSQGEQVTYEQLADHTQQVATHLVRRFGHGEQPIGIFIDRSWRFVAAAIGIMRAGRAYVPLDPTYPTDRLNFIIADSGLLCVIGHGPAEPALNTEWLDYSSLVGKSVPQVDLPMVSGDSPAYIIYTSGSTGHPKGVAIKQKQIAYSNKVRVDYYGETHFRFLLLSSFSFDSSVAGIYWTLTAGGQLTIGPHRVEQDTDQLATLIKEEGITHTLLLPGLYQILLDSLAPRALESLRTVIVAGEACPASLIGRHFDRNKNARLFNEYGPTEATVWCSVHELTLDDAEGPVPIGKPISGTTIILLNEQLQPVPAGLPGEICVEGPGVAEGYLDGLLGAKNPFIHSFQLLGGRTIYRTGDIGKLNERGLLEFLGRRDSQVKINGIRIELDEIRQTVYDLGGIDHCEVLATKSSERTEFYGFYSAKEERDIAAELISRLPAQVIPSNWKRLDTFPRLPNGKIDRKALLAQRPQYRTSESDEPRNAMEQQLLEIWQHVLGHPVSVLDNFFQIGGNSLLSIRALTLARKQGLMISASQFFLYPTIRRLSDSLERAPYRPPENTTQLKLIELAERTFGKEFIGINDRFMHLTEQESKFLDFLGAVELAFCLGSLADLCGPESDIQSLSRHIEGEVDDSHRLRRIIPLRTLGSRVPVFCFHIGDAMEATYEQLKGELPGFPVYGVLSVLAGGNQDDNPESLEELADQCYKEIRQIAPEGPIVLVGYSIGNVLLFEIAKKHLDESITCLMIGPPLLFEGNHSILPSKKSKYRRYLQMVKNLEISTIKVGIQWRLEKLKRKIRPNEEMEVVEKKGWALKELAFRYVLEPADIDLHILRTSEGEYDRNNDSWAHLSTRQVTETVFEGNHYVMLHHPLVKQVGAAIGKLLSEKFGYAD